MNDKNSAMNTKRLSPELSIIVPIYGVEKYLRQCLDSIAAQTFKDFECILVDDGSKDGCPTICDEYAAKDSRFKVIHKNNAGYGAAVNTGFDLAKGYWLGIVEPDDWIAPDMYESLLGDATNDVDIIKSGFDSFFDDGRPTSLSSHFDTVQIPQTSEKLTRVPWLLSWHPSIWTCIYRQSFIRANNIKMEESKGAAWQDNLFQVQTLALAKSILCVPRVMYHYRVFADKPLKDPLLPLLRSLQIRQWLKATGYSEFEPCAALFVREMNYFWMSIGIARLRDSLKLYVAISKLFKIYVDGFKHNYDFRNRGLYWLEKCPFMFIVYRIIRRKLKIGSCLRALHLRK